MDGPLYPARDEEVTGNRDLGLGCFPIFLWFTCHCESSEMAPLIWIE